MKVKYEFDTLAEDFEPDELKNIQKADSMALALWDIKQYLRRQWKYAEKPHEIDQIRENILDIMIEYGVNE